ncbi:MAG: MFS transporter [Chloroflexi bacterium]|nr:MFS transporter [Chloroflexota bacterium]
MLKTVPELNMRKLTAVLIANGLLRVANSAGGALVGFYLAFLASQGRAVDAALVGGLGIVANSAELIGAVPAGMLADRYSPRSLLVVGALIGAMATQLFGITGLIFVFYLSRLLEGISAAIGGPALLSHLTDVTRGQTAVRGRIMAYFELSLLGGLALGTLVGGVSWDLVVTNAFTWMALIYLLVAALFYWGVDRDNMVDVTKRPWQTLRDTIRNPALRALTPAWLAANGVVGLWLTHIVFQLSGPQIEAQYLVGGFSAKQVGLFSLIYAIVTGLGIFIWGHLLTGRLRWYKALQISLMGMLGTSFCFYLLNSSSAWTSSARGIVIFFYAIAIMVQSGFTPAALTYLVQIAGQSRGRGGTMGIYSLLLGLGNVLGAALGGALARQWYVNGLIVGTLLLVIPAIISLKYLDLTHVTD